MPAHPGMSPEGPGEPVSVIVADDQTAVREGLVLLLGTLPGIVVAGQAADGGAAVDLVAAVHPQVVLMDLNMPGCDGVSATRRITADHPGTRVVVLTTYADDESIISALQAGALGYLTKDATRAEIGRAVLTAAAGQAVLDPGVQQRLLSAAARAQDASGLPGMPSDNGELTPRSRGTSADRGWPVQPGDRSRTVRQRGDGQDPRQPDLRQNRLTRPRPGNPLRLHSRLRPTGGTALSCGSRPRLAAVGGRSRWSRAARLELVCTSRGGC
jgi:DNA-binding NarL/FixJ family response regulator